MTAADWHQLHGNGSGATAGGAASSWRGGGNGGGGSFPIHRGGGGGGSNAPLAPQAAEARILYDDLQRRAFFGAPGGGKSVAGLVAYVEQLEIVSSSAHALLLVLTHGTLEAKAAAAEQLAAALREVPR